MLVINNISRVCACKHAIAFWAMFVYARARCKSVLYRLSVDLRYRLKTYSILIKPGYFYLSGHGRSPNFSIKRHSW